MTVAARTYAAIADEIARDIERGRIAVGASLPTHRDMASERGIAVATVTRAYAELRRRGLIDAAPGRGTFVRQPRSANARHAGENVLDLTTSWLEPRSHSAEVLGRLAAISAAGRVDLLGYAPSAGLAAHREAAAEWLRTLGLDAAPENVVLTVGASQAMAAAFAILARAGDTVLCEETTYPGARQQAELLQLGLHGVAMDDEGLRPDALAAAAKKTGAKVLYCMPTLQNPTSAVMSPERRRAIAAVARARDLTVVEDDVYGPLLPGAIPLAHFAPERTLYLTSLSKSVAAALRTGVALVPPALAVRFAGAVRATALCASPLLAEVSTTMLVDGTMERIVAWKRRELQARQALAARAFDASVLRTHRSSQNLWLLLPPPWTAEQFVAAARMEGILVSPSTSFAVGRARQQAVRVSLGPPVSQSVLERALDSLALLLREGPGAGQGSV